MAVSPTVAALYVAPGGVYYDLPGCEPWGLPERDAREYDGPHPVVAHPPCARWGRYWFGGPSATVRRKLGDDAGCFAAALWAVRTFGGVLEHPEASHAWRWFGLYIPPKRGLWVQADAYGWTCCVEQGHYGHRARKATWLYVVGLQQLPRLQWGPSSSRARLDQGFHSAKERTAFRSNRTLSPELRRRKSEWMDQVEDESGRKFFRRLSTKEGTRTPEPFRDLLIGMARGCTEAKEQKP